MQTQKQPGISLEGMGFARTSCDLSRGVPGAGHDHHILNSFGSSSHCCLLNLPLCTTSSLPEILYWHLDSSKNQHSSANGHGPCKTSIALPLRVSLTKRHSLEHMCRMFTVRFAGLPLSFPWASLRTVASVAQVLLFRFAASCIDSLNFENHPFDSSSIIASWSKNAVWWNVRHALISHIS